MKKALNARDRAAAFIMLLPRGLLPAPPLENRDA